MTLRHLRIQETIQVGDTLLLKYRCPTCLTEQLTTYPLPPCRCRETYATCLIMLPKLRKNKRLLVGTTRKRTIRKDMVRRLFEECGGSCAYCSLPLTASYDVEHIVPISAGGTNNFSNLTLACRPCNRLAGSLVFNSFSLKRAYILEKRRSA
jgi:5-methylcytosine-specific restriction endonuclease McrA